ncbi:extracellular solute-binding protein [Clostridium sp.]|uniref:extracellular solute-binding protein n=1 Tax=Clostridium sp. TaxID=1506 RepID=UPI00260504F8|nr:extracellular solute-binding protein [Clostridium sp.]
MFIKFNKWVKIVSVLLICITTFAECGRSTSSKYGLDKEKPVAVEIWHYYNGVQKIEFDKMVDEFNRTVGKNEGIIVEAFNQGSISELTDKIINTANKKVGTGKMPDAFLAYPDTAYKVEKLDLLSDFSKYLSSNEINQYIDGYIDEGKLGNENKLRIFPIAKSTEILMVNKTDWDKFSQETGADIKDFETWEGIAKLAKQYYEWTDSKTETKNDGKAFFGRDAMANYMIIGSKQLGEEIFKEDNGSVTFNLNKEVMRKLWDNFYVPYINGYYAAYGRFRSDDAKTGDIISFVGSTSGAEYFPESVITGEETSYKIEPMILPLPKFKGGKGYMPQQGAGMVVTKSDTKHEYAVTEFLKWFTDVDRNIEFSVKSGYLPVKKEANNTELIKNKIEKNKNLDLLKKSQEAIFTAMNQEKGYDFYTSEAFDGGDKARDILEKSMIDKAKNDREQIKAQLNRGGSKDEILKKYDNDENFEKWFNELRENIRKVT